MTLMYTDKHVTWFKQRFKIWGVILYLSKISVTEMWSKLTKKKPRYNTRPSVFVVYVSWGGMEKSKNWK